jgi:acyl carrier protein
MEDRIKEIMGLVFNIDPNTITANASPDNIENWDSIGFINLISAFEEAFNIEFDEVDILEMLNLQLIIMKINEKLEI